MVDVHSATTQLITALSFAHEEILKSSLTNNISVMVRKEASSLLTFSQIGLFFKLSSKFNPEETATPGLNLSSVSRHDSEGRKSKKSTTPRSSKATLHSAPPTPSAATASSSTENLNSSPSPNPNPSLALTESDDRSSRIIRRPTGSDRSPRTRPTRSMTEREPPPPGTFDVTSVSSRRHSRRESPRGSPRTIKEPQVLGSPEGIEASDGVKRARSLSKLVIKDLTNSDDGIERTPEDDKTSPARRDRRKEHTSHRKVPSVSGSLFSHNAIGPSVSTSSVADEKWGFLQVLVGNYKTLVWNPKIQKVHELGAGKDTNDESYVIFFFFLCKTCLLYVASLSDATFRNQNGRLGRVFNADCPDLRDMKVYVLDFTKKKLKNLRRFGGTDHEATRAFDEKKKLSFQIFFFFESFWAFCYQFC